MITPFEIRATPTGRGSRIVVDGVDISDRAASFALVSRPNTITELTIELFGDGQVEGLAEVTFVRHHDGIAEFLRGIDAEELEKAALARLDFGEGNATQAMLDVLVEWAEGR